MGKIIAVLFVLLVLGTGVAAIITTERAKRRGIRSRGVPIEQRALVQSTDDMSWFIGELLIQDRMGVPILTNEQRERAENLLDNYHGRKR